MWADRVAMAQQFRRHAETLDYCVTGLDNAVRTINEAVAFSPYGVLLAHLPQLYLDQHHQQVDLMEHLSRSLRSLADQVARVAAACGDEELVRFGRDTLDDHEAEPVTISSSLAASATCASGADSPGLGEPVRTMLSEPVWLVGDLEGMEAVALAWAEVSDELMHISGHLAGLSQLDVSWKGEAAASYAQFFDLNVTVLRRLVEVTRGMSRGMRTCVAMLRVSHQWLDQVRMDYEDALDGQRRRNRFPDQVGRHLAYQGLIAMMMRGLRSQMVGEGE